MTYEEAMAKLVADSDRNLEELCVVEEHVKRLRRAGLAAEEAHVRAIRAGDMIEAAVLRVATLVGDDDKAPLPARWYGKPHYLGVTVACDAIRAALKAPQ